MPDNLCSPFEMPDGPVPLFPMLRMRDCPALIPWWVHDGFSEPTERPAMSHITPEEFVAAYTQKDRLCVPDAEGQILLWVMALDKTNPCVRTVSIRPHGPLAGFHFGDIVEYVHTRAEATGHPMPTPVWAAYQRARAVGQAGRLRKIAPANALASHYGVPSLEAFTRDHRTDTWTDLLMVRVLESLEAAKDPVAFAWATMRLSRLAMVISHAHMHRDDPCFTPSMEDPIPDPRLWEK